MRVGETGVGKMEQTLGEMGIGKKEVGEMGVNLVNTDSKHCIPICSIQRN